MQQNDHYEGVLLEEIRDQNKAILEGMGSLKDVPTKLDKMANDIEDIKNDKAAVKMVVKDHSIELDNHDARLTRLEAV